MHIACHRVGIDEALCLVDQQEEEAGKRHQRKIRTIAFGTAMQPVDRTLGNKPLHKECCVSPAEGDAQFLHLINTEVSGFWCKEWYGVEPSDLGL